MALEVRELIIRVTVHDDGARPAPTAVPSSTATYLQQLRDELTQACVRQVLAELQRRRER